MQEWELYPSVSVHGAGRDNNVDVLCRNWFAGPGSLVSLELQRNAREHVCACTCACVLYTNPFFGGRPRRKHFGVTPTN